MSVILRLIFIKNAHNSDDTKSSFQVLQIQDPNYNIQIPYDL